MKDQISIPLSNLINKSFNIDIFPNICKLARVVPVFKSEVRQLSNNYRPNSTSNIGKMKEKLMYVRLNLYLEFQNCHYPFQFGFRLNFLTNNALISIVKICKLNLTEVIL